MKIDYKSCLSAFALGLIAGSSLAFILRPPHKHDDFRESRDRNAQYQLINPLLECDGGSSFGESTLHVLRSQIEDFESETLHKQRATHLSIYYRDLKNGPWFAVNENELFYPASLLKVPTLISALYRAERDPLFLEKKVLFDGSDGHFDLFFPPREKLEKGKIYTVKELLERMIIYSDNNAALLVGELLGNDALRRTYMDLGLDVPDLGSAADYITAKTYSSFFRILYNASYLSPEFSEEALSLLTLTDFESGLAAGVPQGVTISHKFGERRSDVGNQLQLHDCGIVYHPKRPYLLCVMTRGTDVVQLADVISDASNLVWNSVDQSLKKK